MTAHRPVMLAEMLDWLSPRDDGVYIDGTFGAGGYSRAILRAADCRVFAIDRDPSTRAFAEKLEREFPGRFVWILGNFADMCALVAAHGITQASGVVLDFGVSSMQIDQASRGFSFREDGPLDMRMGGDGVSAADVVNRASEKELAQIFYDYGEEKASRRIAHAVVSARKATRIETTRQLAEIIHKAAGHKSGKIDAATKSFQGLRIYVNQELTAIEKGLRAAESLLAPGGRLVVVSFHSLEDRRVKRHYHSRCGRLGEGSRHRPSLPAVKASPRFFLPRPEKRGASEQEIKDNPRARSATMRLMLRAQTL